MSIIYLASPFGQRDRLLRYSAQLRKRGHTITSRWLTQEKTGLQPTAAFAKDLVRYARKDILDVQRADTVVFFTPKGKARGGMHVEFGLSLAFGKRVIVVGPRSTIFHWLPQAIHFDDWKSARRFIGDA